MCACVCRSVLTSNKHEVILVVRLESVNPLRKRSVLPLCQFLKQAGKYLDCRVNI